ncbi:conserved hypothetical protein [Formosa agariphila KMM 3901]|uniref:Uncharacterized protein n=1 Tax=Formosa agariphila (strain DSM 15362 / KCTC 12365 / LMG 23005 / KMM 3901 / M-2Alg 35-1) TaxID=1347342 RepID=T2KK27_FORAG|nr:hypothetical protein [Formosa agariphila]CDF78344.1 conserved hypothetical protein [Formosa agariphila KMM 3901]
MKKNILSLAILAITCFSCSTKTDTFAISKNSIGNLTSTTQIKDLETVFKNDSIVKFNPGGEFTTSFNEIEIFEKGGQKLLTLTPKTLNDSTSLVSSVQVFDSRFKTDKNLSSISTFKDIQTNYKISSIDNLINSVVVSVNELNASFTIDKKELPSNLRFDMKLNIEASQIPDTAKIKYFFLNW